jgi:hypothetical protein
MTNNRAYRGLNVAAGRFNGCIKAPRRFFSPQDSLIEFL